MNRGFVALVFAAFLCISQAVFAADQPAQPANPQPDNPPAPGNRGDGARNQRFRAMDPAEQKALLDKAAEIQKRVTAGAQITAEERDILARARRVQQTQDQQRRLQQFQQQFQQRFGQQGAPFAGQDQAQPAANQRMRHDERFNVLDEAYYQIAELHLAKSRYPDAVAALEQLLKNSPDDRAKALTHLNLAEIYRRSLNNTDKAIEEYGLVTGEYAQPALEQLAQMFESQGKIDAAAAQLQKVADTTQDPTQKVLALKALADLYARAHREDDAIHALQALTKAVSYEQAVAISKALADEQIRREQQATRERERSMNRFTTQTFDRFRIQGPQQPQGPQPGGQPGVQPGPGQPVPPPAPDDPAAPPVQPEIDRP